jgi:hypothetical protein
MHPVPPDWVFNNTVTPQEAEDENPDDRTPALTKEGAQKREHPAEFAQKGGKEGFSTMDVTSED